MLGNYTGSFFFSMGACKHLFMVVSAISAPHLSVLSIQNPPLVLAPQFAWIYSEGVFAPTNLRRAVRVNDYNLKMICSDCTIEPEDANNRNFYLVQGLVQPEERDLFGVQYATLLYGRYDRRSSSCVTIGLLAL